MKDKLLSIVTIVFILYFCLYIFSSMGYIYLYNANECKQQVTITDVERIWVSSKHGGRYEYVGSYSLSVEGNTYDMKTSRIGRKINVGDTYTCSFNPDSIAYGVLDIENTDAQTRLFAVGLVFLFSIFMWFLFFRK